MIQKTQAEFLQDLAAMEEKLRELDACRVEFRKVEEKYIRLLEAAPDATVFVNREGKIVLFNGQLERLFGYSEGELAGQDLGILVPERFRDRHRAHIDEYFANPFVRPMGSNYEIYGLRRDGSEFPADISLSPVETEGNLLATAAIRDITEQKRSRELIERNYHIQRVINSVLKTALEPIPLDEQLVRALDLILTIPDLALEGKGSLYVAAEEQGVFSLKASKGFSGTEAGPCERIIAGRCVCGRAAGSCTTVFADCMDNQHEIRYRGEHPHGHYCVPILWEGRSLGVISLFLKQGHKRQQQEEDFLMAVANSVAGVIRRHEIERERQKLQERLTEAEKLSALGRITANVADEIRNPLTSVGGFARRLFKVMAEGTKEKEYAGHIMTEVTRLEAILRSVLSLSRSAPVAVSLHDIGEVIDYALSIQRERCLEQSVSVVRSFSPVPPVVVDRERMLEAIENLIVNALDAMPHGGTMTVMTGRESRDSKPYVRMSVTDTGEGVPEEKRNMIFEPFFTTKVSPKGTGLGLPIARKIVEDHGGLIEVGGTPGRGASFSILLPAE